MNSIIRVRINRTATGRRIHEALRASGMTVEECASILGFESPRALYRIFSGRYLPSTEHLIGIALLTGVPVEELTAVEMTADGSGLQDFEIAVRKRGLASDSAGSGTLLSFPAHGRSIRVFSQRKRPGTKTPDRFGKKRI